MDQADIRFYAHVQALVAQMSAINASVAGMEALNTTRLANGFTPAYPDEMFVSAASELEAIAEQLRTMSSTAP